MKRLALICAAAAAMFAVACKPEFKEVAVSSVKVTPDKLTLQVGTTGTLSAEVLPKDATKPAVKWASDNESVATVADDGTVTAVAEGTATVTAEADGVAGNAVITVTPLPVPYVGTLSCEAAENGVVSAILTIGKDPVSVSWTYSLDRPAAEARTFALSVDEALVATYNTTFGASAEMLPAANYELSAESFAIAAGAMSADTSVSLKADDLDVTKTYVLPLSAPGAEENDAALTAYIAIAAREAYTTPYLEGTTLHDGSFAFVIANVDCSVMDPRISTDFLVIRKHWFRENEEATSFSSEDVYTQQLINIVNLQSAKVGFDATIGTVSLDLGEDLTYLLANRTTYIMPVQDPGRKVCLTIKGGNTGVGFCNMTDEQIVDFSAQVKSVIVKNGLDGVNLWDVNSGYEKEGAPTVNTTSYPKLIKALREALGKGKLVTLVDYDSPTEYFGNAEACGGIEVGSLLDYAWSGYDLTTEGIQVIDPWHPNAEGVSTKYVRTAIAGLDPAKWGAFTFPIYTQQESMALGMDGDAQGYASISPWVEGGNSQNNIFVANLWPNIQNTHEMTWAAWSMALEFVDTEEVETLSFSYDYTNPRTGKVTTRTVNHKEYTMEVNPFMASKLVVEVYDPDTDTWTIAYRSTYNKWLKDWGTND